MLTSMEAVVYFFFSPKRYLVSRSLLKCLDPFSRTLKSVMWPSITGGLGGAAAQDIIPCPD